MRHRFKLKKCCNRKCKKEFVPKTEWQIFCSARCRYTVTNRRNAVWIKKAKRMEIELDRQRLLAEQQAAQ